MPDCQRLARQPGIGAHAHAVDQPIAVLCHHGGRSMQVAAFLAQHGYEVINVAGGIHAWATQVDPSIPVY